MKITKIERSKRKQECVLVHLEEGDLLRITEAELLPFGIYPGMELDEETLEALRAAGERSRLRSRAAHMASARMLSRKEVRDRLVRTGASETDAADAAAWLAELGVVDDAAYAAAIVRRCGATGYGARRARQELQRRGVPRELWDGALSELPDSAEAIERFIRGKQKDRPLDAAAARKLADALARRGFSWEEIRPALARWGQETEEP